MLDKKKLREKLAALSETIDLLDKETVEKVTDEQREYIQKKTADSGGTKKQSDKEGLTEIKTGFTDTTEQADLLTDAERNFIESMEDTVSPLDSIIEKLDTFEGEFKDAEKAAKAKDNGKKSTDLIGQLKAAPKWQTIFLLIVFLGGSLVWLFKEPTPPSPPNPSTSAPLVSPGHIVSLGWADSQADSYMAVNDESWDAMLESINAKDITGLAQLQAAGLVHRIQAGTKAIILDSGFTSYKVRIIDGPSSGVEGWVFREYVQPTS